ncbi:NAD-dependent epimerase/dehydratase family protein [Actinomadura madurae]|uniref:NAD-dependent epimerase/dehydratase family protein n=1 Tax=Actinomadura madurae TaxID=1993 RepID=UPI0020262EE1|nr:NAD-dependent epimerase/dehydratase family protein [Actinomadura madurae]URM97422.1 NAD-dependent epimerase/dehydratase family protein [Actinomadura madurae]URN08112.1 NAD-dependent epimerase/dehydratase family protein [Actinomadura madurae]
MLVLVTGATGTIGSAVVRALRRRGHDVIGVVRAGTGLPDGVASITADLFEPEALADVLPRADALVHAASSNDERAGGLDHGVVETTLRAFAGTDKPLLYTSGLWLHGNTGAEPATEDSPFDPPMVVSWRPDVERILAEAAPQVRTVRIRPALVYGDARGYVPVLLTPQQQDGTSVVRHLGDGGNRWATVHADDLGDLYALAVESAPPGSVYLGTAGDSVTVADAARVVAERVGATVAPWDPDDARRHWGVMVDAFMLDQVASNAKACGELGWKPHRAGLIDELGS